MSTIRSALITGIGGSGGSYLAEYIVEHHPEVRVHGFARWHSTTQDNLQALRGKVTLHEVDLNDFGSVIAGLQEVRPDAIFHLAAHANVRASFITPQAVLSNNILGTGNLFEAVRIARLDREEAPMRPASPYAVSKVAQDLLGYTYFVAYKMRIIRTRMFAYLNPRRTDLFATSFARQVARIEAGLQKELTHGNLESVRTIVDVRDAMRAYWDALLHCKPGEVYNVGGTTTMTVGEVLKRLIAMATKPIPTRLDPALLRPADVTLQIPNVERFIAATGWKPKYSFDESLAHLLEYWRRRAALELATQ
ncbi:MAG: NAD-dependent epimerase/dehydratase family protein [Betaproteobacteria bacterium]|nr:MAG: NAD-dependent epimerase/dehydratase family protein [Betaproteobacteria bacterium]